jgi:hypothetical protein
MSETKYKKYFSSMWKTAENAKKNNIENPVDHTACLKKS